MPDLLKSVALRVRVLTGNTALARQLQSITMTQTVNSQQIEFVATGNLSGEPHRHYNDS